MEYFGWTAPNGAIVAVTDGNGCYDDKGNCYCAECFYYGSDSVNCANAGSLEGGKPVVWTGDHWALVADQQV